MAKKWQRNKTCNPMIGVSAYWRVNKYTGYSKCTKRSTVFHKVKAAFSKLRFVCPSGYISPICDLNDPDNKRGVNCILEEHTKNAINLLNSIRPELHKRAVAHRCFDATIKAHMTETEIVSFCQTNYAIQDPARIRNDLRNLEVLTFSNPEWGVRVAQTEKNDGAVVEENLAKNMVRIFYSRLTENGTHSIISLTFLSRRVY